MSLESLKKKAETFGEPFRSANLWIPEGTPILENKISYWIPIPWDDRNGRITLAGDAAHPMTFRTFFLPSVMCLFVALCHEFPPTWLVISFVGFDISRKIRRCREDTNFRYIERGQGMNHGIADAASLVTLLKTALEEHTSVKDAVKSYNAEMIARAGEEVAISKENTEMIHDWSRMMESAIMQRGGNPNAPK